MTEPTKSDIAENIKPRSSPPWPSDSHPVIEGPTIWPSANTVVKALMPEDQEEAGTLWRTSAVVEATTDRKTDPKSSPDKNKGKMASEISGIAVAMESKRFNMAIGRPSL